jgi:hypothetical protein
VHVRRQLCRELFQEASSPSPRPAIRKNDRAGDPMLGGKSSDGIYSDVERRKCFFDEQDPPLRGEQKAPRAKITLDRKGDS